MAHELGLDLVNEAAKVTSDGIPKVFRFVLGIYVFVFL